MREYQIFRFWGGNHISGPPFRISCVNDDEAIRLTAKLLDDLDIEIWHGNRRVKRLEANDRVARPSSGQSHSSAKPL